MNNDLKTLALLLVIPIVPFLLLGWYLEPQIEAWVSNQGLWERPWIAAALGVGLLIADIFLPVPSSVVGTFLGAFLGLTTGCLVTWVGLNLGAYCGYELTRWLGARGPALNESEPAYARIRELRERWGIGALAVCRGIPVLAEASVLAAGMYRLSRFAFWAVVAPANFGLALAYALLGSTSAAADWLPLGLALSLGLPAGGLWWLARRSSSGNRKAI
jgi:uncharacterized membrane protein YdjX (TVP38/TMEM64 family)